MAVTDEQILGLLTRLAESIEDLGDEVRQLRKAMSRSKDAKQNERPLCGAEQERHNEGASGTDNPNTDSLPGRSSAIEVGDGKERIMGTVEPGTPDC